MNNDVTWILVCDASSARIFTSRGRQAPLNLLRELEHPESRAANHELSSDRPGRTQQSVGSGRSAMEPHTSPKEVEHGNFAQQLADALRKGFTDDAYQHLVLTAPPQFLGLLRGALDAQVEKRVRMSLDKDYTQVSERDLVERLAPMWEPIRAAG